MSRDYKTEADYEVERYLDHSAPHGLLDSLFESANELAREGHEKHCEHCGRVVFWQQTEKGWRLFQSNDDSLDGPHTCPEYLEFLRKEREKESPGVVINLKIPF